MGAVRELADVLETIGSAPAATDTAASGEREEDMGVMSGYHDLVINGLACDLSVMTERAITAEAERDAYRDMAHTALGQLHDVTVERDRLRANQWRERDEHRRLRESVLRGAAA